jgi:REP element-mobilizing transposase RayT
LKLHIKYEYLKILLNDFGGAIMDQPIPKKIIQPRRLNSLRRPDADYSAIGAYFITICARNRAPLFGDIFDEQMHCNEFGKVVWQTWKSLPTRFPQISIDSAIVMPDHFHGIIEINDLVGEVHEPPLPDQPPLRSHSQPRRVMTIPLVVGYLKMQTAKLINLLRNMHGTSVWQRNYYDKIIESDENYAAISEYILTNPSRWGMDKD